MKAPGKPAFKLDENSGAKAQSLLTEAGYDVATVFGQNLSGTIDDTLIQVCRAENRCLVTLDLDFANPIRYPPQSFAGIVVLRTKPTPAYRQVMDCLKTLIAALRPGISLQGRLWIVSTKQIREYLPTDEDSGGS